MKGKGTAGGAGFWWVRVAKVSGFPEIRGSFKHWRTETGFVSNSPGWGWWLSSLSCSSRPGSVEPTAAGGGLCLQPDLSCSPAGAPWGASGPPAVLSTQLGAPRV